MRACLKVRTRRPVDSRRRVAAWLVAASAALAGCAGPGVAPVRVRDGLPPPSRLLVFGEQHDQPDQQRQVGQIVSELARQGRLAAVVLEMADQGRDTRALPDQAEETTVKEALGWTGWPWTPYAQIVMPAVRAGVPVLGGNLPRARMRDTMAETQWDARVVPAVRDRLLEAIRQGHCGLLPKEREPQMLRVQVARDAAMADAVTQALATAPPGTTVVLHTGIQHASRDRGVPWHLVSRGTLPADAIVVVGFAGVAREAGLAVDADRPAAHTARPDPCEGLADRLIPKKN